MKKLFTLFALLMAIVVGAQAVEVKTALLVTPGGSCDNLTDADGIVTITGAGTGKIQSGNNMNGFTDKAMKLSGNTDFTLSYKSGVTILKVNLYAVTNKDAETGTIGLGGSGKDNTSLGTVPNRKSDPVKLDFTNNTTFRLSAQSNVIIEVKYATEALPTDKATIIEQPKGGKYVLNSSEDVTMSVDAYVTPGNTATYKWFLVNGGSTIDLSQVAESGATSTIKLSDFMTLPITNENLVGTTYEFYCEITSSGNTVTSDKASINILGPAIDAPTFSIASGSTIKVGQKFSVTAPEGSVIYSNWSSSQGKYTADMLMTRTPSEGNTAEVYTTTTGTRFYSAVAVKEGYAPSAVAEVKLNVEALKFKGALDKTSDEVDKDADAPALPVLTLKDDTDTEFAKPGFITATYSLAAGSTDGIVTLKADGSGIESISTATAGTATVNITLASSEPNATLIEGEGTYTYTITVKDGSEPVSGLTITTQPQDVTYTIGDADYPSVTVEAEATVGTIFYDWQYSADAESFNSLADYGVTSASTATLSGEEVITALSNIVPSGQITAGTYYFKCTLTNEGTETDTRVSTLTVVDPSAVNYTKSVNIEQLVLDNGVKYDIANEFAESYVEYASINALDSLNDADGKFQRNEPFLGLKLKASGAYIKAAVKQGSTLKVKFGNIGDNVKVNINGIEQEDIVKMTTKDASYMTTVYEYTADDADAVVTFTTSSSATVVLKQIMIDEDIADVILPWAINKPATVENGTAEMPSSAYPEQQVTITATPANGYELDAITVTGASTNTAYEVDANGTFIMPYEAVNVSVTFKQATAINGIAEDAEASDAANVKVIKNGKLYIGKYNVAGQRVK